MTRCVSKSYWFSPLGRSSSFRILRPNFTVRFLGFSYGSLHSVWGVFPDHCLQQSIDAFAFDFYYHRKSIDRLSSTSSIIIIASQSTSLSSLCSLFVAVLSGTHIRIDQCKFDFYHRESIDEFEFDYYHRFARVGEYCTTLISAWGNIICRHRFRAHGAAGLPLRGIRFALCGRETFQLRSVAIFQFRTLCWYMYLTPPPLAGFAICLLCII